jgi:hypothetical protein
MSLGDGSAHVSSPSHLRLELSDELPNSTSYDTERIALSATRDWNIEGCCVIRLGTHVDKCPSLEAE